MNARLPLSLLALIAAATLAATPEAGAATTGVQESDSSNWSGYVVSNSGTRFASVSASWVQPAVSASSSDSYSVFWVGLGGSNGTSNKLEQVGTEADYVNGKVEYRAWYELVPSAPVKLPLTIHPGDKIAAEVSVKGNQVTIKILDQTTRKWVVKTTTMSDPDTTSAEWIAEAPSACSSGSCQTLNLANFGTVRFNNASATTADGHTGSISDTSFTAQAVRLNASIEEGAAAGPGFASYLLSDGASPSDLSSDGSSFSVAYLSSSSQAPATLGAAAAADGLAGDPPSF